MFMCIKSVKKRFPHPKKKITGIIGLALRLAPKKRLGGPELTGATMRDPWLGETDRCGRSRQEVRGGENREAPPRLAIGASPMG